MLKLTRLFVYKDQSKVNTQTITVNPAHITSVRPSNKLAGQRAVITLVDGTSYDVADKFSKINAAI